MATSGYAEIRWSAKGVRLYCTDDNILNWIASEIKKILPSSRTDEWKILTGSTSSLWLDKLQNKDGEVAFWILKQLCDRGWEPFSVSGNFHWVPDSSAPSGFAQFRFVE